MNELINLADVDIEQVDKSKLKNITDIKINAEMPISERMKKFIEEIENPYCFLVGKTPVKIDFSNDGYTLDDSLIRHLIKMKENE